MGNAEQVTIVMKDDSKLLSEGALLVQRAGLMKVTNDLEEVHLIPVTGLAPTDSQLQILRNLEANLKSGYTLLAIMADLGYRGIIPDNLYLVTCE